MVIIIDNILTPYEIDRYNKINNQLQGNLEVWFTRKTELNRNWKKFPKIRFSYYISKNTVLNFDFVRRLVIKRKDIQRIVCCGWNIPFYWFSLVFAKIYLIRFSLWSGSTVYEKGIGRIVSLPFVYIYILMCDDFIAYGTRAKEYLKICGASEKNISVYYNSVDIDFFHKNAILLQKKRNILRKKYHIAVSAKVVLFVGQLIDRKGVRELLQAFISLSDHKETILLLVGNGHLKYYVKHIIKNNPESSIVQIDHVEYHQIPEIYAISDVLVLPSKEEVWGLVVNEAMASGLPVIVSQNAGCVPDLVKNRKNGFICKPNSLDLEKAISRFTSLSYKKKKLLGEAAWKTMQEIYSKTHFR